MHTPHRTVASLLPSLRFFVLAAIVASPAWAGHPVDVAYFVYDEDSTVPRNFRRALTADDGFRLRAVTPRGIVGSELEGADVVIFPGGSGSKQSRALGDEGLEAVRAYVRDGGGYVGVCAGAYLASAEYSWSLGVINSRVIDRKHWARGTGSVSLSLSEQGREVLGEDRDRVDVYYGQGPLLAPAISPGLPPYTPLALYESGIAKRGAPEGVMRGTTAVASAEFGNGRVLVFSPHPEKTEGLGGMLAAGVRWAADAGR
ncbi:MAG: BPL-N domain-containing protein [Planctomycetota bacterium]